jgi:hypothetical protein
VMLFWIVEILFELFIENSNGELRGMFGWHENRRIVVVLRIGIITVQPNANLLFRNSENSCCSAIPRGRWNNCCSSQLFITIPNNIPTIQNSITFLLSSR